MTGRSCSFTMRLIPEGSRTARIRSIRAFEEFRIDFVRQTFALKAGILIAVVIGIAVIALRNPPQSSQVQSSSAPTAESPSTFYGYEVVHEYPHDPDALIQGLVYHDGFLYESTGLPGQSSIRKVRLETGEVVQRHALDSGYSGEGVTEWHGKLIQLTPLRAGPGLGPGNRIWQV